MSIVFYEWNTLSMLIGILLTTIAHFLLFTPAVSNNASPGTCDDAFKVPLISSLDLPDRGYSFPKQGLQWRIRDAGSHLSYQSLELVFIETSGLSSALHPQARSENIHPNNDYHILAGYIESLKQCCFIRRMVIEERPELGSRKIIYGRLFVIYAVCWLRKFKSRLCGGAVSLKRSMPVQNVSHRPCRRACCGEEYGP